MPSLLFDNRLSIWGQPLNKPKALHAFPRNLHANISLHCVLFFENESKKILFLLIEKWMASLLAKNQQKIGTNTFADCHGTRSPPEHIQPP
jgi:hypothetical protein